MEQAPLISIIMPVYNAGVLLHTAVESVLRQSFADFELLLVDDGSTDGSAALAHELAKKDGRIRVLEQPNAGICAARNLGLQHCRGQWFTFCDDDDTMLPHALETLLVLAKSTGADVVAIGEEAFACLFVTQDFDFIRLYVGFELSYTLSVEKFKIFHTH